SLVNAARYGVGLAYEPLELVAQDLQEGKLIQVLEDYTISLPASHLYYPDRRVSQALRLVIDTLKVT
ncbi:LysR substrate-binding domain-containing protein, partial [Psittacicella gerlachiana]